ncbi:acyltransferase family protein [Phenylobacterium sp. 58.2.17]|uniref:acyltransferase family protein n=1 Tax=Phenylobacterium sp. 58.2.17 TaxID=2969306 RepID=UPI0022651B35|nr:acyltransferase [Phenylobacterium sp. 58.2.17]MCX7587805.1 acyltransferase [Phenylobacterium sp. 58.2.17]
MRSQPTDASALAPTTPFPANLPALTSVRFLLALGVVFFHYQLQWKWDTMADTGLFDRARLGVDVFFILSGFVLTHAYRDALASGTLDYRRFIVARFARIYPAHVAVLTLILVMVVVARLIGAEFDETLYNPFGLLATLLLIHAWFPNTFVAEWNGPSWSLSAEWFAYLLFPVFAWIGLRLARRPGVLLGMAGLLFVALDLFYQAVFGDIVVHAENNMGILRIIPEFLYGVALYRLGEQLNPGRCAAIVVAMLSTGTMLMLMHFQADDRLIVLVAGPLVLGLALLSKASSDQLVARRWMVVLGEASYALYLIHMPILVGWKGVFSILTDRPSTYVLAWWEIAVLLPITIAAALALHLLFEGPARTWIRKRAETLWLSRPARRSATPPEA